jgi:hypothetical protein
LDGVIHDRQRISAAARHAKARFRIEVTDGENRSETDPVPRPERANQ